MRAASAKLILQFLTATDDVGIDSSALNLESSFFTHSIMSVLNESCDFSWNLGAGVLTIISFNFSDALTISAAASIIVFLLPLVKHFPIFTASAYGWFLRPH